jgi:NADPH:quinone reductase-like Zn-dependent oxidoreductase
VRKVVIHKPGSYDALSLETHPVPVPGPGEVRVAAEGIGVNYADCIVRMGLYESAKKYVGWPITPGFEVAGKVSALGQGVSDLRVGDAVIAVTRFGGYATELCVPRMQVFGLPPGLSPGQGAAFPTIFLTAWYALSELARPRRGMNVLVHSAAGGVGGALVQIARTAGAHVVGVVGAPHKADTARGYGAHDVIDKSSEPLWPAAERLAQDGYDIVLDANGVETLRGSYAHLRPTGRLVIYGFHSMLPRNSGRPNWVKLARDYVRMPRFNPLKLTGDNKSVLAFNLSYLFDRTDLLTEGMNTLLDWLAAGRLRAPPVTKFPLERVADAHRALESGTTVGKLVLMP